MFSKIFITVYSFMLIGTGMGQQKRGIVVSFLVPTCIVMNKNVFMCMHWIALYVFKLVLALQKLFQNNYHPRKAKNCIFTKSTDTVTVFLWRIFSVLNLLFPLRTLSFSPSIFLSLFSLLLSLSLFCSQ